MCHAVQDAQLDLGNGSLELPTDGLGVDDVVVCAPQDVCLYVATSEPAKEVPLVKDWSEAESGKI